MVDGIRFDSKREAERYGELKLLEKAGEIHGLKCQPRFVLKVRVEDAPVSVIIGEYVADFRYEVVGDVSWDAPTQPVIVEDVKGFKTPLYRWKRKHVEAQYGIVITEIR